jgi:hypothetical protein
LDVLRSRVTVRVSGGESRDSPPILGFVHRTCVRCRKVRMEPLPATVAKVPACTTRDFGASVVTCATRHGRHVVGTVGYGPTLPALLCPHLSPIVPVDIVSTGNVAPMRATWRKSTDARTVRVASTLPATDRRTYHPSDAATCATRPRSVRSAAVAHLLPTVRDRETVAHAVSTSAHVITQVSHKPDNRKVRKANDQ